jgi:quercetin dioxygenase-like cupin family protein
MPIIEHSEIRMPPVEGNIRERSLVSSSDGAVSLTIKEVELQPGWTGRLHTHPTDISLMVQAGAVQIVIDDETSTIRAGTTVLAPPGVPHKLVNQLWVPVRLLVTYPTSQLETDYLE